MIEKKKMSVLVVSKSPWADSNALGNTLSNLFDDWENAEFYNIYCREELPQNKVCAGYFNITEKQIVKSFFRRNQVGREFTVSDLAKLGKSDNYEDNKKKEKKMIDRFRNKKGFAILREIIWKTGNWQNKKLDSFLERINPDIIFAFAADPIYLQRLIIKCKRKTGAKLVLLFADDTYGFKRYNPFEVIYKLPLRNIIRESVKMADKLYGASKKLCDEYASIFNREIEPLYKGCVLEQYPVKKAVSTPIKIVYAGNLFYGRWEILKTLVDEIVKINDDSLKMVLEIYTTTTITSELDRALNRGKASKILGTLPYDEIKNIFANADIVLHVESFAPKQIKETRLSFSTKIIDCMQSGSCMMAIGPDCVASIEYLKKLEGAFIITDLSKISEALSAIVNGPNMIIDKAKMLHEYAREHHDINEVRNKLKSDFELLLQN